MKKTVLILCTLITLTVVCMCFGLVEATGEIENSSGENLLDTSAQNAQKRMKISFDVKTDVHFSDLVTEVYDEKTRKTYEVHHDAEREILIAAKIGFIEGYVDGTFKPDNPITRAEFIKMLMGLATNRTFNFEAIPTTYTNWAGKFVTLAEMQGIINKDQYTEDDLEKPITRLEVVCMLAKVQLNMKGISKNQLGHLIYTDIDGLTEEEKELLLHASSYDLLAGMKDGSMTKFEPNKDITRGEIARALVRIY